MIISFAWTTEVLLSGNKTCTRRRWTERYFQQDIEAEGGLWGSKEEFIELFGDPDENVVVVRFELVSL